MNRRNFASLLAAGGAGMMAAAGTTAASAKVVEHRPRLVVETPDMMRARLARRYVVEVSTDSQSYEAGLTHETSVPKRILRTTSIGMLELAVSGMWQLKTSRRLMTQNLGDKFRAIPDEWFPAQEEVTFEGEWDVLPDGYPVLFVDSRQQDALEVNVTAGRHAGALYRIALKQRIDGPIVRLDPKSATALKEWTDAGWFPFAGGLEEDDHTLAFRVLARADATFLAAGSRAASRLPHSFFFQMEMRAQAPV